MLEVIKKPYYWKLSLDRTDVHNAFNPEMIQKITETFLAADKEKDLRVITLDGKGRSFCAGADLNWMKSMVEFSEKENKADSEKLYDMFAAIYSCSIPVVAICHGNVFGGGLGLLAAADIVFAEEKTNFCFSEVKWGLAPATILPFVLRKMGSSACRDLMLSARKFTSEEAKDYKLVTFIYSENFKQDLERKTIEKFVDNGPFAMKQTKKLLQELEPICLEENRSLTAKVIARCRVGEEGQEGLNFFLTKQHPKWKPNSDV